MMERLGKLYKRAAYILMITVVMLFMADIKVMAANITEEIFSPEPSPSATPETEFTPETSFRPVTEPSPDITLAPLQTVEPSATPTTEPLTGLDSEFVPEKDNTPFNISVKRMGKEKFSISWAKRKSADRYNVWQKKSGRKKWKLIKTTKKVKYNARVKTGKYYKYKVTAIFGKKNGYRQNRSCNSMYTK